MATQQTSVSVQQGIAFAGMVGDTGQMADAKSYTSAEASAEIPFGLAVVQGTNPDEALIPAANTNLLLGIVLHSHAFQKDNELGTTGLKPKVVFSVRTRGRVWVTVDEAVALTDAVRVRMSGAGAGTFRKTSSAGVTKDISKLARWMSTTSGAGVALLEIDVNNRAEGTND
jgi:hypothetical protein